MSLLNDSHIEAEHWSAIGAGAATDATIMSYARVNDFVILTHDLDFSAILAVTQGEKPSVVQIRSEDVRIDAIGAQVIAALQQMETELLQGALLTVDPKRVRLRMLPLRFRNA